MEARPTDTESSRGEGSSKLKGKGTDPHEWGQLDLNRAEFDTSVQQTALEQWNKLKIANDQQGSKNIPLNVNSDLELSKMDKLTKEKKCRVLKKGAMSKAPAETHSNRQDGVANPVENLMDGALKAKKGEPRPSVTYSRHRTSATDRTHQ